MQEENIMMPTVVYKLSVLNKEHCATKHRLSSKNWASAGIKCKVFSKGLILLRECLAMEAWSGAPADQPSRTFVPAHCSSIAFLHRRRHYEQQREEEEEEEEEGEEPLRSSSSNNNCHPLPLQLPPPPMPPSAIDKRNPPPAMTLLLPVCLRLFRLGMLCDTSWESCSDHVELLLTESQAAARIEAGIPGPRS